MLLQVVLDRMKGMQLTASVITDTQRVQVWCMRAACKAIFS